MKHVPNILCLIRIGLIPFILFFYLNNPLLSSMTLFSKMLTAGILFGIAMLTDLFDGKIARKYNCVTNFGKFIDPIADKLLVICIMMAMVESDLIPSVPVIIIIAREFIVTGLRLASVEKGKVVPANIWGKAKTMIQGVSLGIIFLLAVLYPLLDPTITAFTQDVTPIPMLLSWLCALVTAISAVSYCLQCKDYLKD